MESIFGLEGKKILVLGGGFGMGEATAKLIASLGAHVAVADREADRAEKVAADINASGGTALALTVDVLDDDALVAAIGRTESDLGPLDGMATVIGMAGWQSLLDLDLETWDDDHRRNLRYFFIAAREVARRLLERGAPGSIVCTASVDALRCAPGHASYGAAKAGLLNLVKTMSVEWAAHGIRINAIAPGAMITPRIPFRGHEAESVSMANIPAKKRGTVDDIAKAMAFFLSDLSPYVTGQTLAVDGGFLAAYPIPLPPPPPGKSKVMGEG